MKLSEHFSDYEFKCHCNNCTLVQPPPELIEVLEDVREYFDRPVSIMSGYRCSAHNKAVGGVRYSKHKLGIAADIIVAGIAPNSVYDYLYLKYEDTYGIGSYPYFTHIDVRKSKARWG